MVQATRSRTVFDTIGLLGHARGEARSDAGNVVGTNSGRLKSRFPFNELTFRNTLQRLGCAGRGPRPRCLHSMRSSNTHLSVLPTIHVPTLVLHRTRDTSVPVRAGRFLAENIPFTKSVELSDIRPLGNIGDLDEIEQFLTRSHAQHEFDRATVIFTDIVDSTERAAALGDRDRRRLLDRHNDVVREEIERFLGRPVK